MSSDCTTSTASWNSERSQQGPSRPCFSSSSSSSLQSSSDANKPSRSRCFPQNRNQYKHDQHHHYGPTTTVESSVDAYVNATSWMYRNNSPVVASIHPRKHDDEEPPRTVSQSQFSTTSSSFSQNDDDDDDDVDEYDNDDMSLGSSTKHPHRVGPMHSQNILNHSTYDQDGTNAASLDGESLNSQDWMELAEQGYVMAEEGEVVPLSSLPQEHDIPTMIEIEQDARTTSTMTTCRWNDDEEDEDLHWAPSFSWDESMEDRISETTTCLCPHRRNYDQQGYAFPSMTSAYQDATRIQYHVA